MNYTTDEKKQYRSIISSDQPLFLLYNTTAQH